MVLIGPAGGRRALFGTRTWLGRRVCTAAAGMAGGPGAPVVSHGIFGLRWSAAQPSAARSTTYLQYELGDIELAELPSRARPAGFALHSESAVRQPALTEQRRQVRTPSRYSRRGCSPISPVGLRMSGR